MYPAPSPSSAAARRTLRDVLITHLRTGGGRGVITHRDAWHAAFGPGLAVDAVMLAELLAEIARAEHAAGRPMLTAATVAGKSGRPGDFFYAAARRAGFRPVPKSAAEDDGAGFWRARHAEALAFWRRDPLLIMVDLTAPPQARGH